MKNILVLILLIVASTLQVNAAVGVKWYSDGTWHSDGGKNRFICPSGLPNGTYSFFRSQAGYDDYAIFTVVNGVTHIGFSDGAVGNQVSQSNIYYGDNYGAYDNGTHNVPVNWRAWQGDVTPQFLGNMVITNIYPYGASGGDTQHTDLGWVWTWTGTGGQRNVKQTETANIDTNGLKAHQFKMKKNGTQIGVYNTLANGLGNVGGIQVVDQSVTNGDVITLEMDGTVVATNTVSGIMSDGTNTSIAGWTTGFSIADDQPAETNVTPTGTTTNEGGTTTTTTNPDGTKTTVRKVNNAGTTISGTGTGATNQDIYNDVKAALNDSGAASNGSLPSLPTPTGMAAVDNAPNIGADIDNAYAGVKTSRTALVASTTQLTDHLTATKFTKPSVSATTNLSWSGTLPILGAYTLTLNPYADYIALLRHLVLTIMTICFSIYAYSIIVKAFN